MAIKILHLEDSLADAHLVQVMLNKSKVDFEYFFADNEKDYLFHLENEQIDIILSDYNLPDYSGTEALRVAKSNYPLIPFVFVSGTMGEDAAIESLLSGATDYILKNRLERLGSAVQRAYKEAQEQKARLDAEKELLQTKENFHRSISESPLGIRIVSVDGKTVYANKAFLDIYEFSNLEEFNHTPAKNRYTPESYAQHQERKVNRDNGQDVLEYELSIVRKSADIRHVKVSRKEVLWNGVKHFQVINQDITEQKNLTKELIAAKEHAEESDRLKSAFLANISHEIRTPMNGILGFSELLRTPDLPPDAMNRYIHIIEQSGARLLNIINNILDISKIEAGQMQVTLSDTNVNEQIEYIYSFFKPEVEQKGLQFLCKNTLPASKAILKTDREKIYVILSNLVKNAIKYTNAGAIEFGVSTGSTNKTIEFYVKDTGAGIPEDRQEAIFERFIQADISDKKALQGAGLGLSIAKAYIEMLGGTIRVESEVGKGSAFYFTIPCNASQQEENVDDTILLAGEKSNQVSNLKILIGEDDEGSAILISMVVKNISRELINVCTGTEVVEVCRKTPDIDLVLLDIKMPEMNGYEASRQIRQFNKDVIIIAQTAYALAGDREKAIEAGCNDYVSKPIRKEKLMEVVQKYFK